MSRKHPSESSKVLYLIAKLVKSYFSLSVFVREKLVISLGIAGDLLISFCMCGICKANIFAILL